MDIRPAPRSWWEAEFSLERPNVLACGPVPARTAGLPDVGGTSVGQPDVGGTSVGQPDVAGTSVGQPDVAGTSVGRPDVAGTSVGRPDVAGIRGGRPVRRDRSVAAGGPTPCTPFGARAGRDRPAGRHHGSSPARIPRRWRAYPAEGAHGRQAVVRMPWRTSARKPLQSPVLRCRPFP